MINREVKLSMKFTGKCPCSLEIDWTLKDDKLIYETKHLRDCLSPKCRFPITTVLLDALREAELRFDVKAKKPPEFYSHKHDTFNWNGEIEVYATTIRNVRKVGDLYA